MIDKIIKTIENGDESSAEKLAKTTAIQFLFSNADEAKCLLDRKKSASTDKALDYINSELLTYGEVIRKILSIYKASGATVTELVSILNADWGLIAQIEANGDKELPFDELIIKYKLAENTYPALAEAIKIYMEGEIK